MRRCCKEVGAALEDLWFRPDERHTSSGTNGYIRPLPQGLSGVQNLGHKRAFTYRFFQLWRKRPYPSSTTCGHDAKIPLIHNHAAGSGRCTARLPEAEVLLATKGIQTYRVSTDGPGHATELARRLAAQGHRTVLVLGGDGRSRRRRTGSSTRLSLSALCSEFCRVAPATTSCATSRCSA